MKDLTPRRKIELLNTLAQHYKCKGPFELFALFGIGPDKPRICTECGWHHRYLRQCTLHGYTLKTMEELSAGLLMISTTLEQRALLRDDQPPNLAEVSARITNERHHPGGFIK